MTTSKRVYVLVGDEQTPLSPHDVADSVTKVGWAQVSARYGYSVSTLRKFLAENDVHLRRRVTYEPATELEELSVGG